jgi:5-methylcytosine-specific restriction enzyme subunit McrC
MKQGLHRSYIQFEETQGVMRGRWQLERQLTRQPHVRHLFDLVYDDFSPDTALNRIFQYVVGCLLSHSQEPGNRRLLRDITRWLADVERLGQIPQAALESVHFTRLNERFRPAFNLARLYVENQAFQLAAGKVHTFAFVFDMNRLFEKFVYGFIERHRRQILTDGWGEVALREQAVGKPTYLAEKLPDGKHVFRLRPDILFTSPSGRAVLILDTKYKQLADHQRQLGIAESDMYQMLVYAVALDCPQTLLLYPQRAGSLPRSARFETLGYPHSVMAATISLRRPLDRPDGLIQELNEILKEVCHNGPFLRR